MAAFISVLLASCTATTDSAIELGAPGFAAQGDAAIADSGAGADTASAAEAASADGTAPGSAEGTATANADGAAAANADAAAVASADGRSTDADGAQLPQAVALLPVANPAAPFKPHAATSAEAAAIAQAADQNGQAAAASAQAAAAAQETVGASQRAAPAQEGAVQATTTAAPAAQPIAPKKKSFLSALFGTKPAAAASAPSPAPIEPKQTEKAKPLIKLASATPEAKPAARASLATGGDYVLPGVRQNSLFEIRRKSGLDDDSDVDLHEEEDAPYELASAAGLARLAPNGLLRQTERVDVACLKPSLVRVLKTIEQHYGRKVMVTSGYRDREHNRRARGAKNSLHMYCAAADIQVQGVSKWELAKFVRSMPGRGGVGTYCHTNSVHVDVGPERDWNWRCRRRG